MRQSELFTRTRREVPKDEESTNAKLLIRAGFVNKEMAGVYSFLPLGLRVRNKIEEIIRQEMVAVGGKEVAMPVLHPKQNWEKTGRWETMDDLFRFTSFYTKTDYALGPTHEEIVVPLLQKFVSSYRDLPQYLFQIQTKFRDEKRVRSGLLRGREFLMKDLYSFHATDKDADAYYEVMKKAYFRIFKKVGIGEKTYLTFASGGTFSQYSHEFQTLSKAGEDIVYLCKKCKVAVNKEIVKEQKACPQCRSSQLNQERAIEVGNIFKLKTKYSHSFDFTFKDKQGKEKEVVMGCYGIGIDRLLGTLVEVFHDEKGMFFPKAVAPFLFHLISLPGGEKEAEKLYAALSKQSQEILYDDRKDASPGEKLMDADLIGIPLRIVVSEKSLLKKAGELKERAKEKARLISLSRIPTFVS